MIRDQAEFREAITRLLNADDGLSIESEGTVYIRSLEGGLIVAGILADDGAILSEREFGPDTDSAIDYFCVERAARNHGSEL